MEACKASRHGVAVRLQGYRSGRRRKVVRWTGVGVLTRAVGWEVVRKMGGRCRLRYMPTVAASAFNDWEPVDPKDAITQLGDTLREDA